MAISQLLLNSEKCGYMFYGSIDAMDSVKLSSVSFLDNYEMAISKMAVFKLAYFCCLAHMQHFVAQLHSITI